MSTEADQVNGVSVEETEKPKEVSKAGEEKDQPPQQNGEIGENENTEANANESQKAKEEEDVKKDVEEPKSEDAPTQPEKFVETEVKEEEPVKEVESEPTKIEDTASPAPPQIIVDTVPDRDPESPTEPEAAKPTEESKPKAEEAVPEEEKKPKEENEEKKTEDSAAAASGEDATEEKPKEEEQKEQKEKDESGAASAVVTAETKEEGGDKVEQTETAAAADGAAAGPTPTPGKPNFNGKYKQVSVECENIDAFFQALGLPWLLRKLAGKMSPTTEVRQDGEKFHVKLTTGFLTKDVKFTVGEDFEDGGMAWKKEPHLVSPSWDGDKLILMATPKNEKTKAKPIKQTREMDGEKLSILFEIGDQKCKRIFERKK